MLLIQTRRWLIAIVGCLLVTVVLGWMKYAQISAAIAYAESFPEPSATVEATMAKHSQWQSTTSVIGTVVPTRSVNIRNELDGIIEEVGYLSGGRVHKGQLLLRLNTDDEQAQLDAIEAEVELAKLDMNRYQRLDELNLSSRNEYDRARAQLAISEANARALRTLIARKTLIAPFDAVSGLHEFEPGAYLAANSLVTRLIGSLEQVWVDFSVPQQQSSIDIGTDIYIEMDNPLAGIQASIPARVIAKDAELSSSSRNIRVRALAENIDATLTPGAMVSVHLPYGQAQSVIRLPSSAVRYQASGPYVHVLVEEDGGQLRARSQPVEIAGIENQDILLSAGVEDGQRIATLGSFKLRDGLLVKIAPANDQSGGDENAY